MDDVKPNRGLRLFSNLSFIIGLIALMLLTLIATISDLESAQFDEISRVLANNKVTNISCPLIVTRYDTGRVETKVTNPNDRERNYSVRVRISSGFVTLLREDVQEFILAPGESESLRWLVTTEDAAWDRIILARVYVARAFGLPARTASCGILALNIPFPSGSVIVWTLIALGFSGMGLGMLLWIRQTPRTEAVLRSFRVMLLFGGLATAAFALSMIGWWFLAGGLIILISLLTIALLGGIGSLRTTR